MKKTLIALLIILSLVLVIPFLTNLPTIGYSISPSEYLYTRAICNERNYCQDYEIGCSNEEVTKIIPITGASIQHLTNWKDPREK